MAYIYPVKKNEIKLKKYLVKDYNKNDFKFSMFFDFHNIECARFKFSAYLVEV